MFNISDSFFKKIENKTNINKDTIISLANKLQKSNMKDEKVLRDVVKEISMMAGKEISKEKEDKIVNTIIQDEIPKDIESMI